MSRSTSHQPEKVSVYCESNAPSPIEPELELELFAMFASRQMERLEPMKLAMP